MESAVSEYLREQASAHSLDARSKILMLAVYSVGIFFVETWLGMAVYAALFAFALCASGASARKVLSLVVPVYAIAALTVFFNMFQAGPQGIEFSSEGLVRGLFFAARILLLVWTSLILCLTVASTDLTEAFSSLMSPLRHAKVPVDDIATVFTIALRFIPLIAEEYFSIRDAQWSRGAAFEEGPAAKRAKAHCAVLLPLVVGMFRRADKLACSMDARCYGATSVRRTNIRATCFGARSAAALAACCIACLVVAAGL